MGLVVRENYAWCLVIFMGFGGAEVGDVLKSFGGWGRGGNASQRGCNFNGEGGWGSHYMYYCCVETLLLGKIL